MGRGPEVNPGTPITVFWDLDREWYNAEVLDYDPATGICKVLYTDGEREELDLNAVKHKILWGGKLRERMGKAGGPPSKKRAMEQIVKTLLDVEDRLPPRGVHNNKKRWWSAWHTRVINGGKSGNIADLAKASVEIAFQMKDNVCTSWWKSQRINWQKQVETSTTSGALFPRLTDLLTKAVDWAAARQLFSPDFLENDRKKSIVEGSGQDPVGMDPSGVNEKGSSGSRRSTRQERMMAKAGRDRKTGRKVDEDRGLKKSTSNSAELGLRRSKRKHIAEDDDELSHVDSPVSETPDVILTIAENKPSIVKRRKVGLADEGRLSDPIQHELDKGHSETDTDEDQSSVDETKIRKYRRKGHSIEPGKHEPGSDGEQGAEDALGSAFDIKTQIGYSRIRRSKRSLEPDRTEAVQTSETTGSERKGAYALNEPILEAGNSVYLQEREESTEPKDKTISVGSPLRTRRSAGMKNEIGNEEFKKDSREWESSREQLEQVSDVQIQRKPGRPKKIKTDELEKEDGGHGKERSRNSGESLGISAAKNVGVSAQHSNLVTQEAIATRVETRLRKAGDAENEIGHSGEPVGRVKRTIKIPKKYDAAENDVKSLQPNKVQPEGRQRRIGTAGEGQRINVSTVADGIRAGKEDGNKRADKEKSSLSHKAREPGKGDDGAGPSISDSSGEFRLKRRGRLVRKVSESKLIENQGVRDIDPSLLVEATNPVSPTKQVEELSLGTALQDGSVMLQNQTDGDEDVRELQRVEPAEVAAGVSDFEPTKETSEELDPVNEFFGKRDAPGNANRLKREVELKQKRATASMARSERIRVRSGGARLKVLDDHETEESSGEASNWGARFTRSGKRHPRKIQRSQSSGSSYEETTSDSSSQEDSEEYKAEDEVGPEIIDLEDSWGERLPTDDSDMEDDAPSQSKLKEVQPGQVALSLEPSVTSQEWIVGDVTCSMCNFAGADELMLLCDQSGCTCAIHTFCLTPPLKAIPEGEWLCPHCTRMKANPSDNARLPKTCSTVKYPPKVLGAIIGRRRETSQEEEKTKMLYLVKWDSLSHDHDTWVPEDWLLFMHNRLVTHFHRKYPIVSDSSINVDERRLEWLQVDRIIACRKQGSKLPVKPSQVPTLLRSRQEDKSAVEFLVKWQCLEHKSATWEQERNTDEFQKAISCYTKRHESGEESGPTEGEAKPVAAIKVQPDYLSGGMMYTFQLHGLKWLLSNFEQRRSVILADEMGLGKTVQALAFISCVRYEKLSSRPVLVIAPKSTLPGWEQEFRSWVPGLNVIVYQGDKENRALIREHEFYTASKKPLFEVLLTSYELVAFDNTLVSRFHWASLIVDEGHRVKNVRSKLGTLLKRHKADFRLLLTGTPVQNTLTELFALLHFLDPKEFPDPEFSARQFTEVDVHANNGQSDAKVIEQQVSRLHELLNPRMLRRLKTEVLRDMIPGKKLVEVSCALTPLQRHLYIAILKRNFKVLNKGVKSGFKRGLQMILTDLKMVCNHPYLFPGKEPPQPEPSKAFKMLVAASGKLQLLEKLLPLLKEQGHRVLLFSQMTKMLDILEDFLAVLGLSYSRIDGSCSASSRQKSITEFNAANSSTFIFLISTRAGGLGINLPTADTVIIYDPDFNPFVDLQAQARAHRIGQDKTVLVYQLITKCSVEEKILQRSRKKLAMENLVMSRESKETTADINTLLLHGAQKILDEHDIEATSIKFTDESVKKLLDREIITSTTNDDEPTAHGYLGAVEGAGFLSPTVNEQEDQELKGGDGGTEWHELLHHIVEQDVKEELGRGKRVRKQVVYAVEGHAGGQEEDEYNPSSNESESSSGSDLSRDSGVNRKGGRKTANPVSGGVPTVEYPHIPGVSGTSSSINHKVGPHGLFVPGGPNVPVSPLPLTSPLHTSMLSARGNSFQLMGSSGNMVPPLPLQGAASFGIVRSKSPALAAEARELGSFEGPGSTSVASLPRSSKGATSSHLGSMPTNRTMVVDHSGHLSAEAVARLSTTLLSGAGLNSTHLANSPVQFPGAYPYANNLNPFAVPSYPGTPGPPYTQYNAHTLQSQPLPTQFLFPERRVDAQNLTTRNPAWPSFSKLQQATHSWRTPDVEQVSAPAVPGIARSEGGGYIPGGHHGSTDGLQLPTTSSSSFQFTPSSVQSGSGAAYQPLPNAVKKKRVSDSSHLSSAAAAPWLAGYCTVSNSQFCQVDPKVISAALAPPPIPVPAFPVMSGIPYVPTLNPAFESDDPTVLQVPPTLLNRSVTARIPEGLADRASAIPHFIPSPLSPKVTMTSSYPPHLNSVKRVPPIGRNSASDVVSLTEAPFMTLPYVGVADSMPAFHLHNRYSKNRSPILPMPATLQSPGLGRTLRVPSSETRARVVDEVFLGGVSTGHSQPELAAIGKQIANEGGSDLTAHQLEGSGPTATPKVTPQSRKPLWVPKGDAGLLMGHSQDHGGLSSSYVKVEEGSSQDSSVQPFTASQTRQTK